jgi:hypothetical protein
MVTMLFPKHEILDYYGGAYHDYDVQDVTPHAVNSPFSGFYGDWCVMIP